MKADLTLPEVRAAFFAQYYRQKVLMWHEKPSQGPWAITRNSIPHVESVQEYYLSLRHISSLTEEEVKFICEKIFDTDAYHDTDEPDSQFDLEGAIEWIEALFSEPAGYYIDGYTGDQLLQAVDFLRSIGILIPFRGNSCEEIIEAGLAVYRKE